MWEALFCPVHGVFAPRNWFALIPAYQYIRDYAVAIYVNALHGQLIRRGVL